MPGRSFKNKLSLGNFNRIHQRTASVKSFGIPLIPYKNSLPSDLDIFSVSGNEPEFDDDSGCGPFDDSNIFEIIDMHGSQDSTSSTLPAPVVQNRLSQCSIAKNRRDDENDASAMVRLKKHLLTEVDGDQSTAPLSMYCFMTGFMCVNCALDLLRNSLIFFSAIRLHSLLYLSGALSKQETVYKYEYLRGCRGSFPLTFVR